MLTSFFGNSRPINFLIAAMYVFVGFVLFHFIAELTAINAFDWIENLSILLLCIFAIYLLDFMIRKNSLTLANNYAILLFATFLVMFSTVFVGINLVLANVFLMLALRRIFSLTSTKKTKIKILDASLWISVASLFYFWSLLFFVVLVISILKNKNPQFKNLLILPLGFLAIFILTTTFHFVKEDSFQWFFDWIQPIGFDFSKYNSLALLLPLAFLATLLLWTAISRMAKISSIPKKEKTNYTLIFYVLYAFIAMALLSPAKDGGEFIFVLTPAAIMCTNYFERKEERWFVEAILWIMLLLPITLFFI